MIAGEKVEPNALSDLVKMNSTLNEQLFDSHLGEKNLLT